LDGRLLVAAGECVPGDQGDDDERDRPDPEQRGHRDEDGIEFQSMARSGSHQKGKLERTTGFEPATLTLAR
jgi:hypothetical protein